MAEVLAGDTLAGCEDCGPAPAGFHGPGQRCTESPLPLRMLPGCRLHAACSLLLTAQAWLRTLIAQALPLREGGKQQMSSITSSLAGQQHLP